MTWRITLDEASALELEQIQDSLHGLPRPGHHVGPGIHGTIPSTWNGRDASPGWESYQGSSIKHPTLSQWATPLDGENTAALGNGRAGRISVPQRSTLAAAVAAGVDSLPADWFTEQQEI